MAAPATATVFLSDVPDDISECFLPYQTTLRQRQRATLYRNGQYVHSVKLEKGGEDQIEVSAKAYRSQAKTESPHKISITVDSKQRCTTDAFCSCKAGISGQCSHVLAVLYTLRNWILAGLKDVPSVAVCTSLPQQWDKPRGRKITAEPVSNMVIAKPGKTNRKQKPITAIFKYNRKSPHVAPESLMHLQAAFGDRPIAYLMQDAAETVSTEQGPQLLGSTLATQNSWGHVAPYYCYCSKYRKGAVFITSSCMAEASSNISCALQELTSEFSKLGGRHIMSPWRTLLRPSGVLPPRVASCAVFDRTINIC